MTWFGWGFSLFFYKKKPCAFPSPFLLLKIGISILWSNSHLLKIKRYTNSEVFPLPLTKKKAETYYLVQLFWSLHIGRMKTKIQLQPFKTPLLIYANLIIIPHCLHYSFLSKLPLNFIIWVLSKCFKKKKKNCHSEETMM